jgi:beta-glucosidase
MLDTGFGPLYPFGYGLSYTEFAFSDFSVNKTEFSGENDEIKVSFTIKNTGNYEGAEVAQLYVRDLVGSITRPIKELKGFKKVYLQKGEQQNVEITVPLSSLKFYGLDDKEILEKGEFEVWIATSSANEDIKWKTKITVK